MVNRYISTRLLNLAARSQSMLALTVGLGAVGGVLIVVQARLLSRVIARVFLEGHGLAQAAPLLRVLLVIFCLRAVIILASEVTAHQAASRAKSDLRLALYTHLLTLGPAYTGGERSGELAALAQEGIEALEAYFSQYLPQLALAALVPLTVLAAVFPLDTLSGIVLLLTAPLIPLFMVLIGKGAEAATRHQWKTLSHLSAHFLDILQGLTTLKQLGRSREQADGIARVSERHRQATLSVLRITFLSALALELIATLSTAILAVEIGLRLLTGRLAFEQALFILVLAPEFYLPLRNLSLRYHVSASGLASARRIFEVLETRPQVSPSTSPPHAADREAKSEDRPPFSFSTLRFSNVSYTYPGSAVPALDVSITIEAGQKVALVGATGAGKTTFASLLLRFIEPDRGEIWVDDRRLQSIPAAAWREHIAWVPQRPTLFHDTLENNLRLARPDARDQEVRAAVQQACLAEWVDSLPLGYQTVIGEQGARLSAGQAQRLALARALLKDAPLLILDEPTSNLDPDLEAGLQQAVDRLVQGRTILTIAHRLATVYQADLILVLAAGRIVQAGNHSSLSRQAGSYQQMVNAAGRLG